MCKLSLWLDQGSLLYCEDKCHHIPNSIELSKVGHGPVEGRNQLQDMSVIHWVCPQYSTTWMEKVCFTALWCMYPPAWPMKCFILDSGNDLLNFQHQAISCASAYWCLSRPFSKKLTSDSLKKNYQFLFKKMLSKSLMMQLSWSGICKLFCTEHLNPFSYHMSFFFHLQKLDYHWYQTGTIETDCSVLTLSWNGDGKEQGCQIIMVLML